MYEFALHGIRNRQERKGLQEDDKIENTYH